MGEVKLVDLKSYKDKRNEFTKTLKCEGEIKVPNIEKNPERIKFEQERAEQQKHKEIRYQCKKLNRGLLEDKKTREAKRKFAREIKTMAAISLTSIAAILGASCTYNNYAKEKNAITIEQVLENDKKLEEIGVNEDTIKDIIEMKEIFEKEEITDEDVIHLANNLPELQEDVLKQKIANAVGTKVTDVILNPFDGNRETHVTIDKKGSYERDNMVNQLMGNTVSPDIIDYIDEIAKTENMSKKVKNGEISKEQAERFYKKAVDKICKVATWEVQADKKGNLIVEKNLEKKQEQEEEIER